jgi:hypothetical protein
MIFLFQVCPFVLVLRGLNSQVSKIFEDLN